MPGLAGTKLPTLRRAGEMAQLSKCVPHKNEDLNLIPRSHF